MENFMDGLVEVLAVTLSLGIPVIAIIAMVIKKVKKSDNDREIRRLIIENHTDLEIAKHLIEEPEKKEGSGPYSALRWGCILIGLGLGALAAYLLKLNPDTSNKVFFWVMLAFGCGLGLLCSFIIEYKLRNRASDDELTQI